MTYILKNEAGDVIASSLVPIEQGNWEKANEKDPAYIAFLDMELTKQDPFIKSDIELARVLEDLIEILINKNVISYTDFPGAAQKRLNERQQMREENRWLLIDEGEVLI